MPIRLPFRLSSLDNADDVPYSTEAICSSILCAVPSGLLNPCNEYNPFPYALFDNSSIFRFLASLARNAALDNPRPPLSAPLASNLYVLSIAALNAVSILSLAPLVSFR